MEFRVLGPVQVLVDGEPADLGVRKQRLVLAVLIIEANQLVPLRRLVDLLWRDRPPRSAGRIVQTHISRLRTNLSRLASAAPDVQVARRGSGYVLTCAPDMVDAYQFRMLVQRAKWTDTDEDRARILRQALALWRGPALADVSPDDVRDELGRGLDEARLAAVEDSIDAELRLGLHAQLVHELTDLTARHPHRQRLVGQLMLALYRTGCAADALSLYATTRSQLINELGLEPFVELKRLHLAILRAEPSLDQEGQEQATAAVPAAGPVVPPAQLPADSPDFIGRGQQLRRLGGLGLRPGTRATATTVVVITGMAGVGKTALATHWAHSVTADFPDGQLYVHLRGHTSSPLTVNEALVALLTGLGADAAHIPERGENAAALFRSYLSGRRVLVLLDDAPSADIVRLLLPGSPTCVAVVTSRDRLVGLVALDGAHQLELDVLTTAESRELLSRAIGGQRASSELDQVMRLVRLCAGLPLALRIVAANLTGGGHHRVADYVESVLAGDIMEALRIEGDEESSVPAAFGHSCALLPDPVVALFRLLSAMPVNAMPANGIPIGAVAAVAGTSLVRAQQVMGQLVNANLVRRLDNERFAINDLLRRYAQS